MVGEQGIRWCCAVCDQPQPLELKRCGVCGASFAASLRSAEAPPQRDPNMAALLSLFLPGAGHGYLGLWGQAIARGVLSLFSVMAFVTSATSAGRSLTSAVFGGVAFALWVVAAHDAYRESTNEKDRVLLRGNRFLYLVLVLLSLLFVLLTRAFFDARASL